MPPGSMNHGFLFVESAYLLDVHLRHAMDLGTHYAARQRGDYSNHQYSFHHLVPHLVVNKTAERIFKFIFR